MRTRLPEQVETSLTFADRSTRWYRVSIEPVHEGIFVLSLDITEGKRAAELLLDADRRKDAFLAMLSHELRNPLAPIRNSLYILERATPGSEQARRAQVIIDRQVNHMTHLIDDLLDITRITRGKVKLQRERLDLNQLALRTMEDHRSAFVNTGVELVVLPAPSAVWVDGDPTRLAQVIGNLLQNAAKFTPRDGKATLSIEALEAEALLTVRDTGSGIAPEILPHLFEAFTQAEATLDRSSGGLGLGLALVKGLVEMHGGTASAASDGPGRGASFSIRLPLAPPATVEARAAREQASASMRRVLVIEDNIDAADSLRELLELDAHQVEVAHGGPEGIEKARSFAPDVVLCDIGLPGMDGYAIARALRADPALADLHLVALSGYALPEDLDRAKKAGFDRHLAKPPALDKLEQALREAPSRTKAPDDPTDQPRASSSSPRRAR
jgi:two-component system CheB/CheR fusion protein